MRKIFSIAAAATLMAVATPATAATIWLDSDHSIYSGDQGTGVGTIFSGGGVNVRTSAWSIGNGTIYQAELGVWSDGLGVKNGSSDNSHTVDNSGYLDFIMLQFDQVVELDYASFQTGWHNMNDTDATIGYGMTGIAYTSALPLHGVSQASLAPLNLYSSNSNSGDSFRDINPSGNVGNIWLIGASFNNPSEGRYQQTKLDGFKLEKLTYSVPPPAVPEPSTWAMMLLGFGLVGGAMRTAKGKKERIVFRPREGAFEAA